MLVRCSGRTAFESNVCSKGANTLTSLAVGLKVPTRAMTSSGQNSVSKAYPIPESTISVAALVRSLTVRSRCAIKPIAKVIVAGPSSIAVVRTPTFKGAESEANQIDGHQDADEPITKPAYSSGGEQEADIAPLTIGATHRRCCRSRRISKTSRHTRSIQTGVSGDWPSARLVHYARDVIIVSSPQPWLVTSRARSCRRMLQSGCRDHPSRSQLSGSEVRPGVSFTKVIRRRHARRSAS